MDRRVKERLVGASILVGLIVLVAPELLSGPAPPPLPQAALVLPAPTAPAGTLETVRHVTMDLATSKPAPPEAAPDAAASAASVPEADVARVSSPAADSATAAAPGLEAPSAPSISPPEAANSASLGRAWSVQLGSFASRENAGKLVRQLKAQGFAVYLSPSGSGASARYRVRVGPMADRGAAMQAAAKLESMGHKGNLLPPAS